MLIVTRGLERTPGNSVSSVFAFASILLKVGSALLGHLCGARFNNQKVAGAPKSKEPLKVAI